MTASDMERYREKVKYREKDRQTLRQTNIDIERQRQKMEEEGGTERENTQEYEWKRMFGRMYRK